MMKILAVCGLGMGSSLILRMNIEAVLSAAHRRAEVAHMDVSAAKTEPADLIVTNGELMSVLQGAACPIAEVNNYFDKKEIEAVLRKFGVLSQEAL